jgi:HTH-type transcriptional regulator/antitoxin HipB
MGKKVVASFRREEYGLLIELLKVAREKSGLTQDEVGRLANLSQPVLSAVEGQTRRLDVVEFLDLAEAIGFDAFEMLRTINDARKSQKP